MDDTVAVLKSERKKLDPFKAFSKYRRGDKVREWALNIIDIVFFPKRMVSIKK